MLLAPEILADRTLDIVPDDRPARRFAADDHRQPGMPETIGAPQRLEGFPGALASEIKNG